MVMMNVLMCLIIKMYARRICVLWNWIPYLFRISFILYPFLRLLALSLSLCSYFNIFPIARIVQILLQRQRTFVCIMCPKRPSCFWQHWTQKWIGCQFVSHLSYPIFSVVTVVKTRHRKNFSDCCFEYILCISIKKKRRYIEIYRHNTHYTCYIMYYCYTRSYFL